MSRINPKKLPPEESLDLLTLTEQDLIASLQWIINDPQILAREMIVEMDHPQAAGGRIKTIANPIKFSHSPVQYKHHPPTLGEQRDELLADLLGLGPSEIASLRAKGVI